MVKRPLILFLALVLALSLPGMLPVTALATPAALSFTDPVLEARVRNALGKPEGALTAEDALSLTWLDASSEQEAPDSERVHDVSSLVPFVNLDSLQLQNNAIEDVSALIALPRLTQLWLMGNPLSGYEALADFPALTRVGFDSQQRDLSFLSRMPNLEELRVDGCRELPPVLLQLKNLKTFCAPGGELTDISLLAQMPTLTAVDVSWNLITDISPLAGLPLVELYLAGNPIEDYTPIKALMPNLIGRNFDYVERYEPADPDQVLVFADPVLESKLRQAMNLPTGSLTARDAAAVTQLDLSNAWQPQMPPESQVTDLTGLEAFLNLQELNLSMNSVRDLTPLSGLLSLRKLDAGCNQVDDLTPLAALPQLSDLTLYGNRIKDLRPLAGLTGMQRLHLGNNYLPDLSPLRGLTQISNLYLPGCNIVDIAPLSGMTKMSHLELTDNFITDLTPLSAMTQLVELRLADNPVTDYAPIEALLPNLQERDFEPGQVFDVQPLLPADQPDAPVTIADAGMDALLRAVTGVQDRPLTQADLSYLTDLNPGAPDPANPVKDLSALQYCKNLALCFLHGSQVTDLSPLHALSRLRVLVLNDAQIADLTPLANLTQLTDLDLRGNQIVDLTPLQTLTGLNSLDVSRNLIEDFSPLYALPELRVLRISENQTSDATGFAKLAPALKDKDFDPDKPMPTRSGQDAATRLEPKNPDQVIRFADAVLEKRVREAIGKPEGDITAKDVAYVDALYIGNQYQDSFPKGSQISNLSGIEYFLNLRTLDLAWHKIKDIKKLAGLTRLEFLTLFGNQIKDLKPLAKLENLSDLNVGGNRVTDLRPLQGLTRLVALRLDGNPIKNYGPIEAIYPQLRETDFTLP